MTKTCRDCEQAKPLSEFYVNKGARDGLQSRCKDCFRIYRRSRYSPEKEKARRAYKRANENTHRARCVDCGSPRAAGTGYGDGHPGCCAECRDRRRREAHELRDKRIERWWNDGLAMREIAERLGWTLNHLRVEMDRLRRRGYDLPYRYRTGKRNATKFSHLRKAA